MRRLAILALCALASGCEERPSAATFAAWRKETVEANARRVRETDGVDAGAEWRIAVEGQVEHLLHISLTEIQHGPTTEIAVASDGVSNDRRFRGPLLSQILQRAGVSAGAKTVTLVGKDGYFASFDIADAMKERIVLAFEQDGLPSTPGGGGPISVRFDPRPWPPELQRRTQNNGVLYVTHIIVGDEQAHIRVGDVTLTEKALSELPELSLTDTPVGYRTGWEPTPQTLFGVRVSEVLKAAGVKATEAQEIRLYGKDALHQERDRVSAFHLSDLDRCTLIVVRSFGADRRRVPTPRGGPLLLAMHRSCRDSFGRGAWLSFVESIEVSP